jgi:hypothetical protein
MIATQSPFSPYFDKNGDPLDAGYVYFGVPDSNPETSPIPVYWDSEGTQPVAQPARTLAGYIVRNGSPAQIYAEGAYSQTIKNKRGELVYYDSTSTRLIDAASVEFTPSGTGGESTTLQDWMERTVSVLDYGAVSDAVPTYSSAFVYTGCTGTDNSAAFAAAAAVAAAEGKGLFIPPGGAFYLATGYDHPSVTLSISGLGAVVYGPGPSSGIDGFRFANFNQGDDSDLAQRSLLQQSIELPNIVGFRHPIDILNCAFMDFVVDKVGYSQSFARLRATADAGGYGVNRRFCVQLRVYIRTIGENCVKGFVKEIDAMSNQGMQGLELNCKYAAGSGDFINNYYYTTNAGVRTAAQCVDYFNSYISPIVDGNGGTAATKKVIVSNIALTDSLNYLFTEFEPINMTSFPTMFTNVEGDQIIARMGNFSGNNLKLYSLENFLGGGFETTVRPGFSTLYIYVDVAAAAGGVGSMASPFNTVTAAIDIVRAINLRGNTVVIQLADGTYNETITFDSTRGNGGKAYVIFRGDTTTPSNVILYGLIDIAGTTPVVLQGAAVATNGVRARDNAKLQLGNIQFGATTGSHIQCDTGGYIEMITNWTVDGNATAHIQCSLGGKFRAASKVCNVVSGVIGDFLLAQSSGSAIELVGTTYTGVAPTGRKYTVSDNASIVSGGATIPGTVAGVTSNGGTFS